MFRNQFLIRALTGASIFDKMNAFLKSTHGFKFGIINSLMYSRTERFALHDCKILKALVHKVICTLPAIYPFYFFALNLLTFEP